MSEHQETLNDVFCDVCERLAFMFGELALDDEFPDVDSECAMASMNFTGPLKGRLTLAVPTEICPEIAANVLGLDPDDELVAQSADDALRELLNVTCGNLLTALAGEEPVFDLSVPKVSQISTDTWNTLRSAPGTAAFLVDDSPVLLNLLLEE